MAMAAQRRIAWWSDSYWRRLHQRDNFYQGARSLLHSHNENPKRECRAAILQSGTSQSLQIRANVSFLALQRCPRHCYVSQLANQRAAQYVCMLCQIIDAPGSADKLIVFMHDTGILIALPCPCVMCCCVILEKCCCMCKDTRLRTLISYVLLTVVSLVCFR